MRKSVTTPRSHPEEQEAEGEFLDSAFPCNSSIRKETRSRNLCVLRNAIVIAIANLYKSVDLTELAKSGKLDPVIGRDEGKLYAINFSPFSSYGHGQRFGGLSKVCIVYCRSEYWLIRLKVLSRRTKSNPVVRFELGFAMRRIN